MGSIAISSTLDLTDLTAFLRHEVAPHILEWDDKDHFPIEIIQGLHKVGIFSQSLPTSMGGRGAKMIDLLAIASELGYYSSGFVSCWLANMLAQTAIYRFATESVAKHTLENHLREETLLSFCATELETGNDVQKMRTLAVRVDGGFRITGKKHFITNVNFASHFVVFAKICDKQGRPEPQFSAFLVPASSDGVTVGEPLKKMGQCESNTGRVEFSNVFVPSSHQIGESGSGFDIISVCISRTKTLLTGLSVAICKRAHDEVVEYLLHTVRYGEPLLVKREIQAVLSSHHARAEAAWLLACRSAAIWEEKGNAVYESSVAKFFGADTAVNFVQEALELSGGAGYLRSSMLSKLYRDVKLLEIYEGASLVLQSIIGRALFAPVIKRCHEANKLEPKKVAA